MHSWTWPESDRQILARTALDASVMNMQPVAKQRGNTCSSGVPSCWQAALSPEATPHCDGHRHGCLQAFVDGRLWASGVKLILAVGKREDSDFKTGFCITVSGLSDQ